MSTSVIIPARMASTRFPGKPLALIGGVPMVVRVACQAAKSQADRIIVATDSDEIADAVRQHGFEAVMTGAELSSGTDRCRAALISASVDTDYVINVQGDEPFIDPGQIDTITKLLTEGAQIATLQMALSARAAEDPNKVKVVTDFAGCALYFSRSPIPYARSGATVYFKHVGIYGFRRGVLESMGALPPSVLEIAEGLEQLRWLHAGYRIRVGLTRHESPSVDVPADIDLAEQWLAIHGQND